MSIVSLTFHAVPQAQKQWQNYTETTLALMAENLMDAEKYILSEVDSGMIAEGTNTNLLLIFANDEKREEFLNHEFENIRELVEKSFGDEVMIFKTLLNPTKSRLD